MGIQTMMGFRLVTECGVCRFEGLYICECFYVFAYSSFQSDAPQYHGVHFSTPVLSCGTVRLYFHQCRVVNVYVCSIANGCVLLSITEGT